MAAFKSSSAEPFGETLNSAEVSGTLQVYWLGLVRYEVVWDVQRQMVAQRQAGAIGDRLLLLEHPPTVTIGRRGGWNHIMATRQEFEAAGVAVYEVDRGGDVTAHGPGQLVGYPILHLKGLRADLHWYLRQLEEVMIRVLDRWDIRAERADGRTGVWVGNEKVGAIGVKVARWVTSHGFSLNVGPDLSLFERIVPCGLAGYGVTSISRLVGYEVPLDEVREVTALKFIEVFGYREAAYTDRIGD